MNLLLINKFFWRKGGSEAVYFGEMDLLENHGHQIIPFSMQDERNFPSDYSSYFVSNVDYENTGLREKLASASRIIFSFEARRQMTQLLKDHKIDIAHFHIFQHQISPSVFGPLRKSGIPLVLTLHDLKPICPSYLMYTNGHICEACKDHKFYHCVLNKCSKNSRIKSLVNMVEMYFHFFMGYYKNVDRYIAVSEFYRQKMIEFGFPPEQIIHLPNYVDTEKFRYAGRDEGYGLYFGRLSNEKGLNTLLEACATTRNIPMVITGTGPAEERLREKVDALKLKHITFTGYKSGQDLIDLLEGASFTVLPSEWYENCPMSILESLAVGTPVIGSRSGGIPELINEEQDGFTFEAGNAEELADKMRILWLDENLRTKMGKSGAEKIQSRYTPDVHYQSLAKVYAELS
ncbi:MAG: glycosyltransferase family 4 protein [Sedimenticola sp.]